MKHILEITREKEGMYHNNREMMKMKLAEALMERAELRNRISQLSDRLDDNARVDEGEEPFEDPKRLLEDLNTAVSRYEDLVFLINTANAGTVASNGETIARLIARRDALIAKTRTINSLIDAAMTNDRSYRTPDSPKRVATVDVRSLRREADMYARQARETDVLIQATNWTTEV